MPEPKYEVLDITPELAMSILEGNTHNRNIRQRVVDMYAADMAAGKWDGENGQTIVISDDSRVVDGQHRLWAIVQSETTQRILVVSGVPMTAQLNIDTQAKRKFGDQLKFDGEQYPNVLAGVVRNVALWEAGARRSLNNIGVSHPQMLATLEKYPWLRESTNVAEAVRRCQPIPGSVVGLCHWLFAQIDYEDCEHFFALFRGDHDGLAKTHPVRVLQDTLARNQSSTARLPKAVMIAYVIKAWNAYRAGESISLLRYRPGGANPEKFPEPK